MQQQESVKGTDTSTNTLDEKIWGEFDGLMQKKKETTVSMQETRSKLESLRAETTEQKSFMRDAKKAIDEYINFHFFAPKDQRELHQEVSQLDRKVNKYTQQVANYESTHKTYESQLKKTAFHAQDMKRKCEKTQETIARYERLKPHFEAFAEQKEDKKKVQEIISELEHDAFLAKKKLPVHINLKNKAEAAYDFAASNVVKSEEMLLHGKNVLADMEVMKMSLVTEYELKKNQLDQSGQLTQDINLFNAANTYQSIQEKEAKLKKGREESTNGGGITSVFEAMTQTNYDAL